MKLIDSIKNILKIGTLAGFLAFTSVNCEREPDINFNPVRISNIHETRSSDNLASPSGLSSKDIYNPKKSSSFKSYQDESLTIFAQGPLYSQNFVNIKNPAIYEISENTKSDAFNLNLLFEFPFSDYKYLFNSPKIFQGGGDTVARPYGLTLENLVLEDNSILFTSSAYGVILKINPPNEISNYLEDFQLDRITDMFKSSNGKIYCVQVSNALPSGELLPKRIISIDDLENINIECELPSKNSAQYSSNARYFEQLKIVENSEAGKEKFGTEFYVSDLLEDCIYKIDKDRNVNVLAKGLRYPTSILVDSIGDLFYTTTPLWYELGGSEIEYPTEFRMLNPETGESTLLYTFDERDIGEYTSSGSNLYVMYNGEEYVLPVGYNVSATLNETEKNIEFLFTNSHQGTLKRVTANKN